MRRAGGRPEGGELGAAQRPGVPARPPWETHVLALIYAGPGTRGGPVPGPVLSRLGPPRLRVCLVSPPRICALPLPDSLSLRGGLPAAHFLSACSGRLAHSVHAAGRPSADRTRRQNRFGMDRAPEQVIVRPPALRCHSADAQLVCGQLPAHRARPAFRDRPRGVPGPPPVSLVPALQRLLADASGADCRLAAHLARAVLPGGHLAWHARHCNRQHRHSGELLPGARIASARASRRRSSSAVTRADRSGRRVPGGSTPGSRLPRRRPGPARTCGESHQARIQVGRSADRSTATAPRRGQIVGSHRRALRTPARNYQ